jgi:Xaa-Pro aminopeptidase
MKKDLDRLMQERGLDAIWISGAGNHNPSLVYFSGVANITRADLIKKRGKPPILFHHSMERGEAARTGLACRDYNKYNLQQLLRETGGSQTQAAALRLARMFQEIGVEGRVGIAGQIDLASGYALLDALRHAAPRITLVADGDDPILVKARATKSAPEIESIRRLGRVCASVLENTADFLASHALRRGCLVRRDDSPLTIGDVKAFIRLQITQRNAESPEGLIFAQGRDAGIPHSTGSDRSRIVAGDPIVFDLFPCEAGGGYFYDITRTWCVGEARDEVQELHRQVCQAHAEAVAMCRRGTVCRDVQLHVCRRFAEWGHATPLDNPLAESGYVHNLGHGVGLAVHESPNFTHVESNTDRLESGAVFTIEPGLYYPKKKIGIRLEDTLAVASNGKAEILAPCFTDLVLPARKERSGRKPAARTPERKNRAARKKA